MVTNIWPLFTGKQKKIEREVLLYWQGWNLTAARLGKWKLRFMQGAGTVAGQAGPPPGGGPPMEEGVDSSENVPALYNLKQDPDESDNVAKDHPDIVAEIAGCVEKLVPGFPETVRTAWASIKAKWASSGAAQGI